MLLRWLLGSLYATVENRSRRLSSQTFLAGYRFHPEQLRPRSMSIGYFRSAVRTILENPRANSLSDPTHEKYKSLPACNILRTDCTIGVRPKLAGVFSWSYPGGIGNRAMRTTTASGGNGNGSVTGD
jgi:hypothetical protein